MFPANFAYAIVIGFVFMVDMLLAGFLIGETAIAVVAIGLPCYGMFLALMNAACPWNFASHHLDFRAWRL